MSNLLRWELWLKSLFAAFIGGAANAVANVIVAPATFNFTDGKQKLIESAIISGCIAVCLYLKGSPLPKLEEEETKPTVVTPPPTT